MKSSNYIDFAIKKLELLKETQSEVIDKAASYVAQSCMQGGYLYIFGSGHSHMIAEEIYLRAGGLALVKAILPGEVMLHEMANKSTLLERLDGYASALLTLYKLEAKDTLVVISNSGRNPLPVEMALEAKKIGCKVIGITSMKHTKAQSSRHKSGKNMYEYCDLVIDNLTPIGDAEYEVEGLDSPTGSSSSITGITIIQAMVTTAIDKMIKNGYQPPVFKSSNVDGGDEHNDKLFEKYYSYNK